MPTVKFLMFKLVLEKAEEPETKLWMGELDIEKAECRRTDTF